MRKFEMEYPFAFYKPGINKEFIGRKKELEQFVSIITEQKKSVSVYSPVKTGKETFIKQGFRELKAAKCNFVVGEVDLSFVKTIEQFETIYRDCVINLYKQAMTNALIVFDLDLDKLDLATLMTLPEIISNESNRYVIIYFKEFQNILSFDDGALDLGGFERLIQEQANVRYIFSGSFVNSMKYIFEEKKYFYYVSQNITLPALSRNECIEYITNTMRMQGKVIENDDAATIVDTLSQNIWYIKRVCSTCCSFPVGYMNDIIVSGAINSLMTVLEPQYMSILHDMTPNQVNFLRAIVDEVPRFSSTDVLEKYKLSSSANVCRLKEALKKREIITFDKNDDAYFVDPMFKYWLKRVYFKI